MFQKLGDALRRFMYGRYGADSLNKWLLIFAVILILLGSLGSRYLAPWMAAFNTLAYVPLIWSLFRMYSRNIEARRRENAASSPACATGRTATSPVRAAGRLSAFRAARAESISAAPNAASSSSGKPEQNTRRRLLWKLPAGVCVPSICI